MNAVNATAKAPRSAWLGLAVIALPCVLYAMDLTVLNLALPRLSETLHPTATEELWILDIYGFLVAGALIPMGTLGDRIGRRRLLLIGAAAFGVTSVIAAFASSPATLIASRAVLGLAGATIAPSTLSLIRSLFDDERERGSAVGIWIASYSVGSAVGPLIGGLVLAHFWPGAVFLLAAPVMVLLLVIGPRLLPEVREENPGPVDWLGSFLSLAAVLLTIFGVKRIAADGFALEYLLSVVAGIALGILYFRRPSPTAELFRLPGFRSSIAMYMMTTFVAFGIFVVEAQYLQRELGLTPFAAGAATLPFAGAFIVGSLVTGRLVRRFRRSYVMAGGLLLAAVGIAILVRVDPSAGVTPLLVSFTLDSLGCAPVFTLATELIVGSVPAERAGTAAALSETGSELGGALGIAVMGSIGTAVMRHGTLTGALRAVAVVSIVIFLALAAHALLANARTEAEPAVD